MRRAAYSARLLTSLATTRVAARAARRTQDRRAGPGQLARMYFRLSQKSSDLQRSRERERGRRAGQVGHPAAVGPAVAAMVLGWMDIRALLLRPLSCQRQRLTTFRWRRSSVPRSGCPSPPRRLQRCRPAAVRQIAAPDSGCSRGCISGNLRKVQNYGGDAQGARQATRLTCAGGGGAPRWSEV